MIAEVGQREKAMTWDDSRRLEQQRLENQRREREIENQRVRRQQEGLDRNRKQAEQKTGADAKSRAAEAKSRARLDAILDDPGSYLSGQVPHSAGRSSPLAGGVAPAAEVRPEVSYPTPEVTVTPFYYLRHPEIYGFGVEGLPGGQLGIDWQTRGRECITWKELDRSWRVYRRDGTVVPLELRAIGGQVSMRWLAPDTGIGGELTEPTSIGGPAGQAATSLFLAGLGAWRKRRT